MQHNSHKRNLLHWTCINMDNLTISFLVWEWNQERILLIYPQWVCITVITPSLQILRPINIQDLHQIVQKNSRRKFKVHMELVKYVHYQVPSPIPTPNEIQNWKNDGRRKIHHLRHEAPTNYTRTICASHPSRGNGAWLQMNLQAKDQETKISLCSYSTTSLHSSNIPRDALKTCLTLIYYESLNAILLFQSKL